jgi:hypothetical protein
MEQVHQLSILEDLLQALLKKWADQAVARPAWWDIFCGRSSYFYKSLNFLISCLDEMIVAVDSLLDNGKDKKAIILAAISILYDGVVIILPIWMKPISGAIKAFIIYTLCSILIDFIVSKYNQSTWKKLEVADDQEKT